MEDASYINTDSPKKERDTYDYLIHSFAKDNDNNNVQIGRVWKMPSTEIPHGNYVKRDFEVNFSFINIGLILFRNRVGFFWYSLQIDNDCDCKAFWNFQNAFKEVSRALKQSASNKIEINSGDEFQVPIFGKDIDKPSLGEWINRCIGVDGALKFKYFASRDSDNSSLGFKPDKAILLSYAVINGASHDELIEAAYYLTNGYNQSYKCADDIEAYMKSHFKGTLWYAAKEGAGYYVNAVENGSEFLCKSGEMSRKFQRDYFLMYLLLLHQEYSLIYYARKISELSAEYMDYYEPDKENDVTERLDRLSAEINTFFMKSVYTSVSNVGHQNEFYEYVQTRLGIENDIKSLNTGMNSVVKIQRIQADKKEAEREKEEEKRVNIITTLVAVLAIFSALSDGFSFFSNKDYVNPCTWNFGQMFVFGVVIGVIIMTIIILRRNHR